MGEDLTLEHAFKRIKRLESDNKKLKEIIKLMADNQPAHSIDCYAGNIGGPSCTCNVREWVAIAQDL